MDIRWKMWDRGKTMRETPSSASDTTLLATDTLDSPKPPNPWDRPFSILLLVVWFGLVTGGAEALTVAILYRLKLCALDVVSPYLWVIPISNAVTLAIPGMALYVLGRFRIVTSLMGVTTFLLTFVLSANLVLAIGVTQQVSLSWWAIVLLAGGLATQARRLATKYPHGFHRLVTRTTLALIVITGLVAVGTVGSDALNRRNMALGIPPASANAPNVLLIVLDTVRAKSMSLYGHGHPTTPNLERWAKQGIVFDRAISPAPFTLTAHASMFTGRYPQNLTADWTVPLDNDPPTLAEALYAQGYMTAGVVSNTSSCGRQTGLGRGFVLYEAHRLTPLEFAVRASLPRRLNHLPKTNSIEASRINERFFRFLEHRQRQPFFVFLNYFDCHAPYFPEGPLGRPYRGYSRRDKLRLLQWTLESFMNFETDGLDFAREAYEASLAELDSAIGALLAGLEERGEREHTLVIIVGDHGEQFGEHGLVQHADSLYRPVLHVPLLIIDPRSPTTGQRVHEMVSLRDLPATILELLGLPTSKIPGDSFAGLATGQPSQPYPNTPKLAFINTGPNFPAWHPNSTGPLEAVFADGKYYIKSPHREELYDFDKDPEEQANLAESEAGRPLLPYYQELLSKRMGLGG
ncbi:MAG TPA: hypothetical protein DCZ69_12330 [Syntrophobacteraceae bacterium]|nr:hypothetical protein [Syntrophobacteraceae bacterium]